ncbi:MAG TPA: FKBP-type peptidyl-prolyl cis-trans isomerase [Flavobacteriales bacterium]|nr:FKBP-type peptidyl-prolyl cis-trans isomerase [Flavobacteriales bacterium]
MNRQFIPLLALALCVACGSPYEGYKEVGDGVHLRYIALGEGEQLVNNSDSVLVRFRIAGRGAEAGSFLSTERWYLGKDLRVGAMVPIMRRLHVGDSMSVIAAAVNWPWRSIAADVEPPTTDTLMLDAQISLLQLRTAEVMRADAERLRREDPTTFERRLIEAYVSRSKEVWTRWGTSDLHYIITGTAIDTNRAQFRQPVVLSWKGQRLEDGHVFDEQGNGPSPFTWSYGTPDQLVQGLETAVMLLREGQEGRFIMPSSLAFGARGIPGVLDASTPVLYSVRLQRIDRGL